MNHVTITFSSSILEAFIPNYSKSSIGSLVRVYVGLSVGFGRLECTMKGDSCHDKIGENDVSRSIREDLV